MPRRKTQQEYEQQVQEKAPHIKVIGDYNGNRQPIEHYCLKHNVTWHVSPFNFLQHPTGCKECQDELLKTHHERRKKSNEQFIKEVSALGTGIIPLCDYNGCHEKMSFRCKEGHVWDSTPHDILDGYGCPYCVGSKVLIGYNDLWTTCPDVAKMLRNPDVGYTISKGSHQKVEWICPECGTVKIDAPKQIVGYGLACSVCSDGISYPNRFMVSLLKQLNVDFIPEYSPEWIKPYRYDFLLKTNKGDILVELDGGIGHGCVDFRTGDKDAKGLHRDIIKNNAAKNHNIELIRIDCKYMDMKDRFNYVTKSILNSKLNKILNFSCVNFEVCNKEATKSLHMEAAKLYDMGFRIREISDKLNVSYDTIYKWLKRLSKEGLCSYKPIIGRHKI